MLYSRNPDKLIIHCNLEWPITAVFEVMIWKQNFLSVSIFRDDEGFLKLILKTNTTKGDNDEDDKRKRELSFRAAGGGHRG